MTVVSFLIPFRGDGGWRDTLFNVVTDRLTEELAFYPAAFRPELQIAGDGSDTPEMFNHPRAINRCASWARGDVFVIIDADTTFDNAAPMVGAILATIRDRRWRLPQQYIQLREAATHRRIAFSDVGAPIEPDEKLWVGDGISWSGIVIVPREAFELVGGYDERYEGWGADDGAFAATMTTLYGPAVRYPGACVHLWHERGPQEQGVHPNADAGRELTRRYIDAWADPAQIRKIIAERP